MKLQMTEKEEHDIVVFPLGVGNIRAFNKAVERILAQLSNNIDLRRITSDPGQAITAIVPMIMSDALEIVDSCVEGVNILHPRFPHHLLPDIVRAWMEESFGTEGKRRPWVLLLEEGLSKLAGKKVGLSDTLSKFSSNTGIVSTTS